MRIETTAWMAVGALFLLAGCATSNRAPIEERSVATVSTTTTVAKEPAKAPAASPSTTTSSTPKAPTPTGSSSTTVVTRATPTWDPNDPRPESHTVQRGETLFAVALSYGLTYRELAQWNGLEEPFVIKVGQALRLRPPENVVTVVPLKPDGSVEGRTGGADVAGTPTPPGGESGEAKPVVKNEPKALKLPYSDATWARYQPPVTDAPAAAQKSDEKIEPSTQKEESKVAIAAPSSAVVEGIEWAWPTEGKLAVAFDDKQRGVTIAGNSGQPVLASAAGQVSYVGNSLRGYGRMIVIKHNKMFLSVYAHNSRILVREGQSVTKGQKIAEMGSAEGQASMLHFEIRRYGKPVDPLKYLPNG